MSDYLGVGLEFPLNLVNGSANLVRDSKLIENSIKDILNTPKGTRFFLPQYGSRLRELTFEPNDDILIDLMNLFIIEAITKWEKRVSVDEVTFDVEESVVYCTIKCDILNKNEVDTFIFPFYRKLMR